MKFKDLLLGENVGGWDLTLRALLGSTAVVILALDLMTGVLKWVVALIALGGLYTSITRHCTPYVLLGINTSKEKR